MDIIYSVNSIRTESRHCFHLVRQLQGFLFKNRLDLSDNVVNTVLVDLAENLGNGGQSM